VSRMPPADVRAIRERLDAGDFGGAWQHWVDCQPRPHWEPRVRKGELYHVSSEAEQYAVPAELPELFAWQTDPTAPTPPGYVRAQCACSHFLVRPPGWVGTYESGRTFRPTNRLGERCDVCGARSVAGWEAVDRPPVDLDWLTHPSKQGDGSRDGLPEQQWLARAREQRRQPHA
jgi:hypothetical protein